MHEIELKFLLDEPPANIWARAKKLGLASATPRPRTLRSIYMDTPELSLRKAGIALRLRRDGRRWIQTVKTSRSLSGGLSQSGEIETEAPGGKLRLDAIADEAVRQEVLRQVGGAPLNPVCETVIRRASGELSPAGDTLAELAVDVGTILANGKSAELREVEIELLGGSPRGLFDIAQALFPEGGLKFSRLSKSARGYLLAESGRIEPPPTPRNAREVPLQASLTAEEGARNILRECADQIAANIEVMREIDAPEGPHQLRVGLRRLRSMFAIYAPVARSAELKRLDGEARWLGQEVGLLRDLDVARDDIVTAEARRHESETSLPLLAKRIDGRAAARREALRTLLAGPRVQSLVLDLTRFVETRGWLVPEELEQTARLAVPVTAMAGEALDRRWRKVGKRARKIDELNIEQRHELRKELKKLRYAIEFFGSLYEAKRVEPMIKRLKRLQEVFGALNDVAMVRNLLDRPDFIDEDDAHMQRAVGWVLGSSEARAELGWSRAKEQWRELKETRLFWK
jgi:triphosphatase